MNLQELKHLLQLPLRSIAILLAMVCIFALSVDARTVSVEEAMAKAQRFYANAKDPVLRSKGISAPEFKLAYEAKTSAKTASCFYVLNQSPSKGFIIISADDCLPEVLGYSDSGDFDINQIPDNMKWWLSEYERQIEQVLSSSSADDIASTEHREGWTPIESLVKTKWNQDAPYNNLCPAVYGKNCLTGCVATAMAQIMNYHQWPATGRGSHSYEWNGQTLSMDFSTVTFGWEKMQDISYSPEAQNAVATLMLACGISVDMGYGIKGSDASSYKVSEALFDYFDYDADYLARNGVELPYWESLIYNELVNKRPVYYSGSSETSGHAFVCDGYSNDGLFHINWGWGGDYNGYFLLNVLDPRDGRGGYSNNQSIIYGISPINIEDEIKNGIIINAENFPDDNFRKYLFEHKYAKDGVLIEAEIKKMQVFNILNRNISSLKGIEHFTALVSLLCDNNQLTNLDVSNNTALKQLWCDNNQLTNLDVSNNTALTELMCNNNQLTNLDVSNCTALVSLLCYKNQLTNLDVSNNTALTDLKCHTNQLTALDVSNNTELKYLSCHTNQLTALDVSNHTALEYLYCYNNQITALDVSNCTALTSLDCYNNAQLTFLNCSRSNLKGEAMDNIINYLPQNTTNEVYKFYVYDDSNVDEGNICTKEQVAAVKARGWTPYYYDVTDKIWREYDGSDEESTVINNNIKTDIGNAPIYNLNGQRVNKTKNGLYIINGKKVFVK